MDLEVTFSVPNDPEIKVATCHIIKIDDNKGGVAHFRCTKKEMEEFLSDKETHEINSEEEEQARRSIIDKVNEIGGIVKSIKRIEKHSCEE